MHRKLKGLSSKVLLDTNIILDATFINGASRRSVDCCNELGYELCVCEHVLEEMLDVLGKHQHKFGSYLSLRKCVHDFLRHAGINSRLGLGSGYFEKTNINSYDRPIAQSAYENGAWVLTGDAGFCVELQEAKIDCRTPPEVIIDKDGYMGNFCHYVTPLNSSGMIFGSVIIGAWAGLKGDDKHYVGEIRNMGGLYFDRKIKSWVFDTKELGSVKIRADVAKDEIWAVCGTYDTAKTQTIKVFAAPYSPTGKGNHSQNVKKIGKHTSTLVLGECTIGHSIERKHHWNGHLRHIVCGPQVLGARKWKNLLKIKDSVPNPYDQDQLERTLEGLSRLARQIAK